MTTSVIAGGALALSLMGTAPAAEAPPAPLLCIGAAAAALFAAIIGVIAWKAGQWTPSFLALGCISMAQAAMIRCAVEFGVVDAPSGAGNAVNVAGLLAGGAWFAAGSMPRTFLAVEEVSAARKAMVAGAAVSFIAFGGVAWWHNTTAIEFALRAAIPIAAAGYTTACLAFIASYRFMRLPSQLAMAVGTGGFASIALAMAQTAVAIPAMHAEVAMLVVAGFAPAGFIAEQRSRPGLRTMVLSLFLDGAFENLHRGHPGAVVELAEQAAAYDEPLRGHLDRVARLAVRIGAEVGMTPDELRSLGLAAQLHDIGKLTVPTEILNSPGKLTGRDWETMQGHALAGEAILLQHPATAEAARAAGEHHERWDGTGYPRRKRGEDISLSGRIVAVADVYDALTSRRSYKQAWHPSDAMNEIRAGAGLHFDPEVVEALASILGFDATDVARAA